ncbi:hypothetical protein L3X38_003309 [Prunus dulcis]|uniref:Uncharacterized protein n=1 Tax=Prunus dulcis TaxID=3755 RepID=A0AAD5F1V1_PRUDU|nr:hypothetical protein L3X38_003309 [Prunus dulcis]
MDSLPLTLGTFWVQLHGVPAFCMTVVVAKAIGLFSEKFFGWIIVMACVDKYELSQGSLTPSLLAQFSSAFVDLEGGTNLRGNSIGSSARRTSAPSPPYKSPLHSPPQSGMWINDGSGDPSSSGTRSWRSFSREQTEVDDSISPPVLPLRHTVLDAVASLRCQSESSTAATRVPSVSLNEPDISVAHVVPALNDPYHVCQELYCLLVSVIIVLDKGIEKHILSKKNCKR